MKAKIVTGLAGKRTNLGEVLPLNTPFSVHVFPAYVCNFKCSYCLHNLSESQLREMSFKKELMNFDVFVKGISSIKAFPTKLKTLIFAGHGEPLMNKRIADMVAYAKNQDIAERIEIVTNGYLLTPALSDALINAGLDLLRVSIQGLSKEKYEEVVGVPVNFESLMKNLRYFYENKTNTKVYIKIIDVGLDSKEEEQKFYDMFGSICDEIAVEYVIPFAAGVDYSTMGTEFDKCKQGHKQIKTNICAMPFYMLAIEPDGSVVPCCSTRPTIKLGKVQDDLLSEIWNSQRLRSFQVTHLKGEREKFPVCRECTVPTHGMQQGDYLDNYAQKLLEILE